MRSLTALFDDPMNHILSVAMSVQVEIKDNYETYLKSQLEYYISLLFHYLHIPSEGINFEVRESKDFSILYQNTLSSKGLFVPQNISYEYLLTRIRPYRILELISAILHERPIFIVDDDMNEMAVIMQSLVSMIKPLTWVSPIVPMIPEKLADIIGSPMGALIGIHTKIWDEY